MNEALGRTVPCAGRCGRRVPADAALYSHTASARAMLAFCDYCGAVAQAFEAPPPRAVPPGPAAGCTCCRLATNH